MTKEPKPAAKPAVISTHTPTQGVTILHDIFAGQQEHFYSHAHAGRDAEEDGTETRKTISTHTPTQGVTT